MAWPKAEAEQQYVIDIDDVAFSYFVADMLPRLPAPALKSGRGHPRTDGGMGEGGRAAHRLWNLLTDASRQEHRVRNALDGVAPRLVVRLSADQSDAFADGLKPDRLRIRIRIPANDNK
ncbi:hypothetical protein Purlil1_13277 [Purpureocillium lilacinum]|uniref:Uncharacterized protein n=1 Tax=Purpureocillium lilacinum TaxID=33203 RepID=A0ABR0BEL6_PURLI|nr:hypothetical protein Purlil1_13277 [Purpureocillium lilacinum]